MDSDEEIPLASEEERDSYNCSGDDVTAEDDCSHHSKKDYTVLKEERIKQLQENDISEVSGVLSISRGTACTLLLRQSWKPENYCKICMENVDIETMLSAACGHLFCSDCWNAHVSISINDGPGCLSLHCPEPKCEAIAGLDMVESVAADDDKQVYYKYLRRSYVELSKNRKWCPAPGCDAPVEFDVGGGDESYDISCDCSYKFCWSCTEEKWLEKNSSEADNIKWIMAFTKPCPMCKRKIEKNSGGCSKPCRFEFCWLCLKKWKGRKHNCKVEASSKEASRNELRRYSHYFKRWISNHRSRNIALADLARARNEHVPLLSKVQGKPARP
ncbi:hypothetical protein C2S52_019348 [Perilla frutescens var. hirtella]|nr:hypothetical protein C2S52_019348 [Perilla frutescens var. hirtella]